jgi:hypothetical protein
MASYRSAEEQRVIDFTDAAERAALDSYVPLVQQGLGTQVFGPKS